MTASASLLTPSDLAERLGVHLHTLARWRHRGGGPRFVRVGRSIRYRPADVDAWLDARSHTSTRERAS